MTVSNAKVSFLRVGLFYNETLQWFFKTQERLIMRGTSIHSPLVPCQQEDNSRLKLFKCLVSSSFVGPFWLLGYSSSVSCLHQLLGYSGSVSWLHQLLGYRGSVSWLHQLLGYSGSVSWLHQLLGYSGPVSWLHQLLGYSGSVSWLHQLLGYSGSVSLI